MVRNRYILLADIFLVALGAFAAFVLRLDWSFPEYKWSCLYFAAAAVVIKPTIFFMFGLYRRYWRYAGVAELVSVFVATSLATIVLAVLVAAALWTDTIDSFPRSVIGIDWLITLMCTGGVRLAVRVMSESFGTLPSAKTQDGLRRVLVAGAGDAGAMVVREMQRNPQLGIVPVGFLDDDPTKRGKRIYGVPIIGPLEKLASVVTAERIGEVVIAMPRAGGRTLRRVAELCRDAGVPSRTMPGVFELIDGNVSVNRLRKVEIADLLRRSQVGGSPQTAAYLKGQTVLVTGAGGSIGYELCRQIAFAEPRLIVMLGHGENSLFDAMHRLREAAPGVRLLTVIADVRNGPRIKAIFERFRPEVVFHAAAHKHVPLMEENPEEAITNNVIGTYRVVEAATAAGTQRLVLISTDKAVQPSSVMGATKRMAELVVRTAARNQSRAFMVVRFGNVLGSRGSVVPLFKQQIERGGPVTVTHPDMKRFFMTIPEAVHLVLEAGGLGRGGELFVLNMGEPVLIVDLAKDLIRLSGISEDEMPVIFTGMRAGEKLEEALWEDGASVEPTTNPDVLRVTELEGASHDDVGTLVQRMIDAAVRDDRMALQVHLAECVHDFVPSAARPH